MSKTWSKEDRYHFEKSEVMKELETKVLDTIKRADILQQKISVAQEKTNYQQMAQDMSAAAEAGDKLSKSLEGVSNAAAADDGLADSDESHEGSFDHADDEYADQNFQDEIIDDLNDLAAAAIAEGNIKLAYRIERTIDEILEQSVSCE
tara:strand:- start:254 stop:700 length:447 start_codon:yes stop_codon:yes gene_type:complete